jgi:hypothetical protein
MRKRDKKLELHRETVHRLDQPVGTAELAQARGAAAETGFMTSCIQPNCCGDTIATQTEL